jgi:large subunit ribosomal protein L23
MANPQIKRKRGPDYGPKLEPHQIILRPLVTEKGMHRSTRHNAYAFEVSSSASKRDIGEAIKALYKVVPEKIRTVSVKPKKVFVRGKEGAKKGLKKAYVYLKKGDRIEVM